MANKPLEEKNREIRKRIVNLTDVRFAPLSNSMYLQPLRMHYIQDGKKKIWDFMKAYDSVVILIFNRSRKKLVFVKQFRPASYCACIPINKRRGKVVDLQQYPPTLGLTIELCCGAVDKDKSLIEIARDEVREECGYEVPLSTLNKIVNYTFVGSTTSKETLFYAEVTDEMNIHSEEAQSKGELIEVIEMSINEVNNYITSDEVESPPSLLNAVYWFLINKKHLYSKAEKSRL
ncbi:PREDICTED: uridine diphosphate glucose pyrophosphatase-like [Ceratosolen solmsi marchali]|uniref:Uridine diphosphate glucose pyrophosphatase NUDT14 n=1 Tax=Ceratosolen solmsi marchali TaxID=326594 RepID=A0AAJ7DXS9_9HYME|nr:PREDICTED: uridine diphosphate glucose pyrophosphatase-like [Ceratosolen solmsi marchali]